MLEQARAKAVGDIEVNRAAPFAQGLEAPRFSKCENGPSRYSTRMVRAAWSERHLRAEALAEEFVADRHGGDEHLLGAALLAPLDLHALAEWQELRIVLDARDEREHVVRGVVDNVPGLVDVHGGLAAPRSGRSVAPRARP